MLKGQFNRPSFAIRSRSRNFFRMPSVQAGELFVGRVNRFIHGPAHSLSDQGKILFVIKLLY
jgi:hypothetical protein